jgi:hypothetical protein
MIFERVHGGDAETKADRAIRGTASPLGHDVAVTAEFYQVGDDQKIPGKAKLFDDP